MRNYFSSHTLSLGGVAAVANILQSPHPRLIQDSLLVWCRQHYRLDTLNPRSQKRRQSVDFLVYHTKQVNLLLHTYKIAILLGRYSSADFPPHRQTDSTPHPTQSGRSAYTVPSSDRTSGSSCNATRSLRQSTAQGSAG